MRFQVPTALHQQLARKAQEEGLTVEEAVVRAIECWVAEDQVFELVVNQVLDRAGAKVAAVLDKALEAGLAKAFQRAQETSKPERGIDALLREGFRTEAAEPEAPAWKASEDGWDPNAEPWE
jgi:hypothetical protein